MLVLSLRSSGTLAAYEHGHPLAVRTKENDDWAADGKVTRSSFSNSIAGTLGLSPRPMQSLLSSSGAHTLFALTLLD
jgi:hypothetical protein